MRADPTDRPALEALVTVDKLARLAARSRRTIQHWIADGTIRPEQCTSQLGPIPTGDAGRYLTGGGDVTTP